MARRVAVVPHTHWDREWYLPFQSFRLKLVDLLDELLPLLQTDLSYRHFQLDGQMAVVDDYLEVRPEAESVLRRLASAGRISMGPWYALPDEFLVSGETLVRNLQLGMTRAGDFGGPMQVGYLPDMFGHVAQMPQILRQFGLEHAVVWRGVPRAVDRSAFWWSAPDGSTVRAEYLPDGYGNGAHLPDDAKELVGRVRQFVDDRADLLLGDVLWMNGTDHLTPNPSLGHVVADANDVQDEFDLEVTALASYLATAPTDGLAAWAGELRSGARANLLMGVASNRLDVRRAVARAERQLEALAEPLSALHLDADRWPARALDLAWLRMIRNSAHDSVCACSIDEVCDAVLYRYAEAQRLADGLTERALRGLAGSVDESGALVVNPSSSTRSGLVELRLPGEGTDEGMQLLSQRPTELTIQTRRADAPQIVSGALDNQDGYHRADVSVADDGTLDVIMHRDTGRRDRLLASPVLAEIAAVGGEPEDPVRITLKRPPSRRALVRVTDVAGYGWQRWEPTPLGVPPVTADGTSLDNGLVRVEVDPVDATFSVDGTVGLGRLVDGGDTGDTYNYNPADPDVLVDRPDEVVITVDENGPLRARLTIDATYTWPHHATGGRRDGSDRTDVRTRLELRAGEDLLRVQVTFDNRTRDHRLRAHFPLPAPATSSSAECAFAVVERGLEAEGGPTERALPTYPSRRFVRAGGLTVVHEGLLEYELIDLADGAASTLALTLIRCTGMLSQGPMAYRPLPAGPLTPLEGSQLQGPITARYAVHVGDTDPYALVDQAFLPLLTVDAPGGGTKPSSGTALDLDGAVVSSVRRAGGSVEVRVFNPGGGPAVVSIPGRRGWLVDLTGAPREPVEGRFDLAPWAIATVVLED